MLRCLKFLTGRKKHNHQIGDSNDAGQLHSSSGTLLGQGGFAKVYLVAGGGSKKSFYAVKVAEPQNSRQLERLEMEILIHRSVNHESIVKMLDFVVTPNGQFYICLEYCEMGSLYSYVNRVKYLDCRQICDIFGQLVEGCEYLHEYGIIHRDLKPQNILLRHSMEVKITDFGLSILTHGQEEVWTSVWGSPGYVPPEVLLEPKYTTAADVWALGCVLFWMYAGFIAFPERNLRNRNYRRKIRRLSNIRKTMEKWNAVAIRDLLLQVLQEQPDSRPSCTAILDHEFLNQGGSLLTKEIYTHDRTVAKRYSFSRAPFNLDYWVQLFGR